MTVVSASVRTDIPAFYSDWMFHRLLEGWTEVWDPYTGRKEVLSLFPQDVGRFVFWSRNYRPFSKCLEFLSKRNYSTRFHYTITGLPKAFETHLPPLEESLKNFIWLSQETSPDSVYWRFDPVVLTEETGTRYHLQRFAAIAQSLQGLSNKCIFDFVKPERERKTIHLPSELIYLEENEEKEFLLNLAALAGEFGFQLLSAREKFFLPGVIETASCQEGGERHEQAPEVCSCRRIVDIGTYESCPHGCAYCFAVSDRELAVSRWKSHRSDASALPAPAKLLKQWTPKWDPACPEACRSCSQGSCKACMLKEIALV